MSVNRWINNFLYICAMQYYSAVKHANYWNMQQNGWTSKTAGESAQCKIAPVRVTSYLVTKSTGCGLILILLDISAGFEMIGLPFEIFSSFGLSYTAIPLYLHFLPNS